MSDTFKGLTGMAREVAGREVAERRLSTGAVIRKSNWNGRTFARVSTLLVGYIVVAAGAAKAAVADAGRHHS
jgi:hypothetical protein